MTVLSTFMGGASLAGIAAAPAPASDPAHGSIVARIPFDMEGHLLYITCRAGASRPLTLIIETGAGTTALDARLADALGATITGTVPGAGAGDGVIDVRLGTIGRFQVGDATVEDMIVAFMPLDQFWAFAGRRFDGLLGQDFLGRCAVEIDYAAHELRLHDPERFEYSGPGQRLPSTTSMSLVAIDATVVQPGVAPAEGRFIIDTGAGALAGLVLSGPFVAEHGLLRPGQPVLSPPEAGHGIGGSIAADIGRIAELRLGEVSIKDAIATFTRSRSGFFAMSGYAGVIGNETLRRFRLFIDYRRNQVVLEPDGVLDEPFRFDASGLILTAEGPDLDVARVSGVLPGTPAAAAGVREGDVLLELDGAPVTRVCRVREALREPGRHALRLRRGDAELTLIIEARELI